MGLRRGDRRVGERGCMRGVMGVSGSVRGCIGVY